MKNPKTDEEIARANGYMLWIDKGEICRSEVTRFSNQPIEILVDEAERWYGNGGEE